MRPVTYYVTRIADEWSVTCSHDSEPPSRHPDRFAALRAAEAEALRMWEERMAASTVLVDEDDGRWHNVVSFGSILG